MESTPIEVGGIVAVALALVEVIKLLIGKVTSKNGSNGKSELLDKVRELHAWHDKDNPMQPGMKAWYVPHTLEVAIDRLASNVSEQTGVVRRFSEAQKSVIRRLENLERRDRS